MTTRDKLEYQKRLRFLREARAKTASEQLKLAKAAEESDLTKRMVTLGDKENRVPARGNTPKAYNEVPKTRETSRVKDPLEAGDKGDNVLDIDLSDLDYAKISEQKRFYIKRVGREERNEPYSGPEMEDLDIEPQFYSDEAEAGTVADMLINLDPHGMEDFYVANLEDEPLEPEEDEETLSDEEFEDMLLREATPPQEDADQSLARMKKRKKATRTKNIKRKSHANLSESNLDALLRECGCEMESPFDAPEDEPQGYMLKQSLEKIGSQATDLSNVANHDDDPEPWVEFKVTSAAEQIDAVHDYIKYGRKHRSDMSGHEDMHSGDDMMNEKVLRKLIRKTILEQPINLATRTAAPSTTRVAPAPTTAGRRAPPARRSVADPKGAFFSIFNPDTPRSLVNHLTRLRRGIASGNLQVANYELAADRGTLNTVLNSYIPLINQEYRLTPQAANISNLLSALVQQITAYRTPPLPTDLRQIRNRTMAVQKIDNLYNALSTIGTDLARYLAAAEKPTETLDDLDDEYTDSIAGDIDSTDPSLVRSRFPAPSEAYLDAALEAEAGDIDSTDTGAVRSRFPAPTEEFLAATREAEETPVATDTTTTPGAGGSPAPVPASISPSDPAAVFRTTGGFSGRGLSRAGASQMMVRESNLKKKLNYILNEQTTDLFADPTTAARARAARGRPEIGFMTPTVSFDGGGAAVNPFGTVNPYPLVPPPGRTAASTTVARSRGGRPIARTDNQLVDFMFDSSFTNGRRSVNGLVAHLAYLGNLLQRGVRDARVERELTATLQSIRAATNVYLPRLNATSAGRTTPVSNEIITLLSSLPIPRSVTGLRNAAALGQQLTTAAFNITAMKDRFSSLISEPAPTAPETAPTETTPTATPPETPPEATPPETPPAATPPETPPTATPPTPTSTTPGASGSGEQTRRSGGTGTTPAPTPTPRPGVPQEEPKEEDEEGAWWDPRGGPLDPRTWFDDDDESSTSPTTPPAPSPTAPPAPEPPPPPPYEGGSIDLPFGGGRLRWPRGPVNPNMPEDERTSTPRPFSWDSPSTYGGALPFIDTWGDLPLVPDDVGMEPNPNYNPVGWRWPWAADGASALRARQSAPALREVIYSKPNTVHKKRSKNRK